MPQFLQSRNDFPVQVTLSEKAPSWGLSRWAGQGLRFIPPDDEEFTLRGGKQRLVYTGRRRSHRFTILGDTAFEYDCILNREPESNVVTLLMEGAENFDFFRQPDFVKDPFLKGSYAVYKKETLTGEGTGKLCHIHRPRIIDSRGRRCWGSLSVAGSELRITIPETFLSGAEYPVIVDPTIGTTTVGSQYLWDNNEPDEPLVPLAFEYMLAVNRFLVTETINGSLTAYIYTNGHDPDAAGRPVLYSDNGGRPLTRRSRNEGLIDFRVTGTMPKGWRSGTFASNGGIAAGSYIWFGVFAEYWWYARFDYGAKCYRNWWDAYDSIPDTYPMYDASDFLDFKLSMYFIYTSAQNYTRTLTQGVTLTDTPRLTGAYKRSAAQTVTGTAALSRLAVFPRQCLETVYNAGVLRAMPVIIRFVLEYVRGVTDMDARRGLLRNCGGTVRAGSEAKRSQGLYREARERVKGADVTAFPALFFRGVPERAELTDSKTHWGAYVRGLREETAGMAEAARRGDYRRVQRDTVRGGAGLLRYLFICIRLLTLGYVRDFILRRFLRAREEIVIKSKVTTELTIDGRV
jgi:hypothetical protein